MALKFRRGTTAQQSGSLAFGEPYVNTTLGTLLIGGPDGDIILGSSGTGSTGNFGAISGSGLDITGNANIAGNLTLGGQLTIGDAAADTVNVVASLSSSLIPQADSVYDLGSATKSWKDLYVSTGSIKFVANGAVVSTLSTNANGSQNFPNGINITGSLIASGSNIEFTTGWPAVGSESHFLRLAPFTASNGRPYEGIGIAIEHWNDGTGTYEHSLQIHSFDNDSNPTYGAELNVSPFRTHIQALPSGSGVTNVANISVQDLKNGKSQALVYGDYVQIGVYHGDFVTIGNSGSVVEISGSVRANITGSIAATNGVVSGSSQITYSGLSGIPAGIVSGSSQLTSILPAGVVSGSSQVIGILSSLNTYTGSNDTINTTQTSRLDQLSTASGSAITRLTALEVETANLESFTSSINTTIKSKLDADGVISGSSQLTTTFDARYLNTGGDSVVSGSSQITLSSTTGGGTTSNVQFGSLGIGMAATGTSGRIDAANDIVAFSSSDIRFKENIKPIENAIDKIRKISGNTYDWKEENKVEHGYEGNDVGVIAQEIEAVLPQLVQTRESGFKAVKYDKLVALLIEGIKEQQLQIEQLRIDLNNCTNNKGL
jgi:hypothetical protein